MFHCLVIKVVCLHLSADSSFIISLAFCFVKNFFILFFKFFFHLHQQLWYNIMSSVSCQHFFYIFFNFIQPNLCCLSKKIRLTQKRIYHIIIFSARQALFYIFLHIFLQGFHFSVLLIKDTHKYLYQNVLIIQIA